MKLWSRYLLELFIWQVDGSNGGKGNIMEKGGGRFWKRHGGWRVGCAFQRRMRVWLINGVCDAMENEDLIT
jgi:hypothetical protein